MTIQIDRRKAIAAGLASAAAWSAPSILGVSRASAAPGSCLPENVAWTSGGPSGGGYVFGGTSGGLSIQAVITPNLSLLATSQAYITNGRIGLAMQGHSIGDNWQIGLTFSAPATILTATTTIIDIDQNGLGLACGGLTRYRDEITNVTGTGLTATPLNNVVESPAGTFGSGVPCASGPLDGLTLDWTDAAGVTAGGFSWVAGTPPGLVQLLLDPQLILISPMSLCVTT